VDNQRKAYPGNYNGNIMAVYEYKQGSWSHAEQHASTTLSNHLYGSERLGVDQVLDSVWTDSTWVGVTVYNYACQCYASDGSQKLTLQHHVRYARSKKYELTNHTSTTLSDHPGNVMVVVSDMAIASATTDFLLPDVVSATDYFPFGMELPNRTFSAGAYDFGFNTQMESPEILAGHTTALYWEYDGRIGRRWELDPVVKVWESGYAVNSCNPILMVDPLGNADYVNAAGVKIGTDGDDTNLKNYFVTDVAECEMIEKREGQIKKGKKSVHIQLGELQSEIKRPDFTTREELGKIREMDATNPFKEHGGLVGLNAKGETFVGWANPSNEVIPGPEEKDIQINVWDMQHGTPDMPIVLFTFHDHPSGTVPAPEKKQTKAEAADQLTDQFDTRKLVEPRKKTYNFLQPPSNTDIANQKNRVAIKQLMTNVSLVFAMRDNLIISMMGKET
jgi:hypothetical protein